VSTQAEDVAACVGQPCGVTQIPEAKDVTLTHFLLS